MTHNGSKVGPITLKSHQRVRFYSLARHALSAVFKQVQIAPGHKILLPDFICRDLLAAVNNAGLIPVWYEMDGDLKPKRPNSEWPRAIVVLSVNYFGFPQDLEPFFNYTKSN